MLDVLRQYGIASGGVRDILDFLVMNEGNGMIVILQSKFL